MSYIPPPRPGATAEEHRRSMQANTALLVVWLVGGPVVVVSLTALAMAFSGLWR